MTTIGYARISTDDGRQSTLRQVDELRAAGCDDIFQENASGADRDRPVLKQALRRLGKGDTLCVIKLDRLARSTKDLLEIVERIEKMGARLRVLGDSIDTSTPAGRFFLTLLAAFAEFERETLRERTVSGLRAAARRGRKGGNPALVARDPAAIRRIAATRKDNHVANLIDGAGVWLPRVRQLRSYGWTWEEVSKALNSSADQIEGARQWTMERLVRSVKILVKEGMAEAELLKRAQRDAPARNLVDIVAGIAGQAPRPTLKQVATRLEDMRVKTPKGGSTWPISSVAALIARGEKLGMLKPEVAGKGATRRVGRPRRTPA